MRHRVGSPLMAMLIDGHMEKGQGFSKTRAAYDQLLGAHFEMNKELQCKFLLTHLHEDANAAQFDWKLRSFHYGAMRKVSVDLFDGYARPSVGLVRGEKSDNVR